MAIVFDYREQWLAAAFDEFRGYFEARGYSLPTALKVSCGWPVGCRGSKRVRGQCFSPAASKSGATEVFISPVEDDPLEVLGIAFHEGTHAAVGNEAGHGPTFQAACKRLGLEGKATSAMPGPDLRHWLKTEVLPMLGDYPHASVDFNQRKKQGTRMIKLVCPVSGYTVRTTAKWIKEGLPTSPAGYTMQPADAEGEGEDE